VTPEKLRAGSGFLQNSGTKPEFVGHSFEGIEKVKECLVKTGIPKETSLHQHGSRSASPTTRMIFGENFWRYLYLINT
jgi:hypothetical protein